MPCERRRVGGRLAGQRARVTCGRHGVWVMAHQTSTGRTAGRDTCVCGGMAAWNEGQGRVERRGSGVRIPFQT